MSRRALYLSSSVLLALLLIASLAWWSRRPPEASSIVASKSPLVRTLQFSARVATLSRVDVGSTLTARVREVLVNEGAPVEVGDVLVRLESEELKAALAQAEANERQAQARLSGLRSTGRLAVQASVTQAESVLVAARAELQRTQDLVSRGFLSQSRLDEARRAVDVAQAQVSAARAQRDANADSGTDVAQAQAQLALASAARRSAQVRLKETDISAPAKGKVLSRSVEPGQIVQPGRALLTLALSGPLQLVAQVDERYLEQLAPGQPAQVLADAYPAQAFQARVLSIAPVVDSQRGAIEVKFSLPAAAPDFLREDMTVSIEVETARREQALVVPVSALRSEANAEPTVWVERDGRVEERRVRLGLRTLAWAEVLEGLNEGDAVLFGPAPGPGARVRAVAGAPVASAQAPAREDAGAVMTNAVGR
ncbi:efflux RND transporter periplasmic adaptor subunit [Hydrogenophaga sp. H7]|uniref:efflux RND transporter periplasmic adaptor subunit n=1 Tax=Hydrogenophaga sp. H7 TaxID=1882399 RepID=UPI0009A35082|nr:efflux RND transporter periplasmic adaptor subunit [Hydrogenophaga sp. H7]OPF63606.1 efflux transporter periplasmic adaptor subunit [Hydrogenophaga sp. H7]